MHIREPSDLYTKNMAPPPNKSPSLSEPFLSPSTGPPPVKLTIDEMLQKHCGEFGRWQLRHFALTNLALTLEAFHTMVMVFTDREPEFRCVGGGCDAAARSVCGLEPGSWEWVGGSTTVSEWGLVCGEKYKVGLVQSAFFVGCLIGAGVFGYLADSTFGRKGALVGVCIIHAFSGILTAFSPNYWVYLLLRLITGIGSGGVGLTSFVLSTEPVGPTKRGVVGGSSFYFFSSGIALVSALAYFVRPWRVLYIVSSVPSVVYLIFGLPFVSESPRWYLVRGRVQEAMKVMRAIAHSNGSHIPNDIVLALDEDVSHQIESNGNGNGSKEGAVSTGTLIDVIGSPMTRNRLILSMTVAFLSATVYYGLSLNVVNLDTNLYVNVAVNALAEMPSFTLTAALLDRVGRKPLAMGTQLFTGFFCLIGGGIVASSAGGAWAVVKTACGVLGVFGTAGTYNLMYIYAAELFPTVVRNAGLGCSVQAAQVGAIVAPLVVVMPTWLPFTVLAGCSLAGGLVTCLLPETWNQPLYDTIAGMEGACVS
ncbi:Organic cation/carnitine transporter 4 [Linum perenne]